MNRSLAKPSFGSVGRLGWMLPDCMWHVSVCMRVVHLSEENSSWLWSKWHLVFIYVGSHIVDSEAVGCDWEHWPVG